MENINKEEYTDVDQMLLESHKKMTTDPNQQKKYSNGFDFGLELEQIIKVTVSSGKVMYVVKWKKIQHLGLVTSQQLIAEGYEQLIIDFLESKVQLLK